MSQFRAPLKRRHLVDGTVIIEIYCLQVLKATENHAREAYYRRFLYLCGNGDGGYVFRGAIISSNYAFVAVVVLCDGPSRKPVKRAMHVDFSAASVAVEVVAFRRTSILSHRVGLF